MKQGIIKCALVICPISIMDSAWRGDLFSFAMHRSVGIAYGTAKKRKEIISLKPDFLIINYDGLEIVKDDVAAAGYDLIIVDEASHYKNSQSVRWKVLNSLVKPDTWLWMMTGTPAAQGPEDAYGLAKLVNPQGVPKYFTSWRDQVMYKETQFKWKPKKTATDAVHKALQPAIRFTKEECLDLPDMLYTTREVPLTVQQQKYYDLIRKSMVALAAGAEITAVNAAGLLNKLLQISQGVAYTTDKEVVEFDVTNRLEELVDVIGQTTHKIIVFIPFRHAMAKVQDELSKRGFATDCIHGGVPAGQRAEIIKRFQTEASPRILLLIPQAAAHGITLTKADTVVWWGPTSSAEMYLQGNARAHRAGQINKVTVVRLQGSPVERRMYDMLDGKVDMHQTLVDLYKQEIA
jgi:SNF2 family DNA or RNA helicase